MGKKRKGKKQGNPPKKKKKRGAAVGGQGGPGQQQENPTDGQRDGRTEGAGGAGVLVELMLHKRHDRKHRVELGSNRTGELVFFCVFLLFLIEKENIFLFFLFFLPVSSISGFFFLSFFLMCVLFCFFF